MRADYVSGTARTRWQRGTLQRVTSKVRTKLYFAKGYFQDKGKGCGASARTQVYLSKTKLRNTGGVVAVYIVKVQ